MQFDITIGEAITHPNHKNKYRLNVQFMHGDADGYSSNDMYFDKDDADTLVWLNKCLTYISVFEDNEKLFSWEDDEELKLDALAEAGLSESDVSSIEESGMKDSDMTCDGCRNAMIEGYTLTFFDENGVEHETTIEQTEI